MLRNANEEWRTKEDIKQIQILKGAAISSTSTLCCCCAGSPHRFSTVHRILYLYLSYFKEEKNGIINSKKHRVISLEAFHMTCFGPRPRFALYGSALRTDALHHTPCTKHTQSHKTPWHLISMGYPFAGWLWPPNWFLLFRCTLSGCGLGRAPSTEWLYRRRSRYDGMSVLFQFDASTKGPGISLFVSFWERLIVPSVTHIHSNRDAATGGTIGSLLLLLLLPLADDVVLLAFLRTLNVK